MQNKIGQAIRIIRNHHKLSQTDFGKRIGLVKISICFLETGRRIPRLKVVERIHSEFGMHPYVLAYIPNILLDQLIQEWGLNPDDCKILLQENTQSDTI